MSVSACRTLAESEYFQGFIMGVIVLTAVLTGLETSAPVRAAYGQVLHTLNIVIQAIFVCELVFAYWPTGSGGACSFATAGTSSTLSSWRPRCCRRWAPSPLSRDWHACCAWPAYSPSRRNCASSSPPCYIPFLVGPRHSTVVVVTLRVRRYRLSLLPPP